MWLSFESLQHYYIFYRNEDTGVPGSPSNTGGDRGAAFSWTQSAHLDYTDTFSLYIDCLEHVIIDR